MLMIDLRDAGQRYERSQDSSLGVPRAAHESNWGLDFKVVAGPSLATACRR